MISNKFIMFAIRIWVIVFCLKADFGKKRTAGVSWRQIKAVVLTQSHSPLQCLPQFTLHFCQCVEKAGWGQAVTHMLIHRIIVTKARGKDGRLLNSEKETVRCNQHCGSFVFLYVLNLKLISGLMQGSSDFSNSLFTHNIREAVMFVLLLCSVFRSVKKGID